MKEIRESVQGVEDPDLQRFQDERVKKLIRWSKQARLVFPLVQRGVTEWLAAETARRRTA